VVGVIGGGADWHHPALRDQYRGANGDSDYAWLDAWRGVPEPEDVNALGTHTVGIIVGKDGIGVAPGAEWIACRSLARDMGNSLLYLTCMQFTFAPYPSSGDAFTAGDPARGADLVEAAWDCPVWEGCDASTLSIGVTHLTDAGQMFITGTGNNGPACGTIDPPGLAEAAFTVGSLDQQMRIADFSSRGPITADGSGRIKPDVMAPGSRIISAMPDGRYAQLGGSSMASSFVSGMVALLWSADPTLIGDIDRTKAILTESARPVSGSDACGDPRNSSGYGRIDAYAALMMLMRSNSRIRPSN
jgi:subtilisin family serine protease